MPDAVQALDVTLDRTPEQSGVHGLVVADGHVRQVRDGVELVVQELKKWPGNMKWGLWNRTYLRILTQGTSMRAGY